MGYFLDYELFTPCWYCGKTDCSGNHYEPEARAASGKVKHFERGFGHPSCNCEVCKNMRERAANRNTGVNNE